MTADTVTSLDFSKLKIAVARQFDALSKQHELFVTNVDKDGMWNEYLSSFPPGTNPMHRVRTEHDCSCCRQFIKAVGNVVAIVDGKITSIWDITANDPAYQVVADAMSRMVKSHEIQNIFLTTERKAGTDKTFEQLTGDSYVKTWNHFYVNIPGNFVCRAADIGPKQSDTRASFDVMKRSLEELTLDAIDTVQELIAQNSLYRGTEHTFAVDSFRKLRKEYQKLEARQASRAEKDAFVWSKLKGTPPAISRIRNTSIGTLLVDLSSGVDMEDAVRKFEAMVAPSNYKRPTALVTKKMVENAKAKIQELGLTSALERRYALLSDISINDILFADRNTRKVMEGDVFDSIETSSSRASKSMDKVESISIDKFISDVLPTAQGLEVLVENNHVGNLMSLVAPVDPTARNLFMWDNNFSWSYNGDLADSIKERVKRAGGNVSGDLCCRLAWHNHDDLDFHMKEPNGHEIYFGNKGRVSACGGKLDVDMNAGIGHTREPVENIFYKNRSQMREGIYHLFVRQYTKRETRDVGFEVEFDFMGDVHSFAYDKAMSTGTDVTVAKFRYSKDKGVEIIDSLSSSRAQRSVWGIKTNDFQKVNVMMFSPNYWNEQGVGNKHYFFMLEGCQNEGTARGFYNEFLKSELTPHRKVIEIVGSKMRTDESAEQLSGLGFSSTQRAEILVRVKGAFTRTLKIQF